MDTANHDDHKRSTYVIGRHSDRQEVHVFEESINSFITSYPHLYSMYIIFMNEHRETCGSHNEKKFHNIQHVDREPNNVILRLTAKQN